MKKRIISLILVVAMLVIALTGCSFNYAKANLSKYATFDDGFKTAIQKLVIEDGSFGTDPVKRWEKVEDAIAAALLAATDSENLYEGKPDKYDSLAYCYYAVYEDENGNKQIVYTSKMDEAAIKPTTGAQIVQLGLSSLTGLNKAISDAILKLEGDSIPFYSTSANTATDESVVSVTYTKTEKDNASGKTLVEHESVKVGDEGAFAQWLLNKKVGVVLDGECEVVEGEKTYIYSGIKINSVIKSSTKKPMANAGDLIYITYTATAKYTSASEGEVSATVDGFTQSGENYVKKQVTALVQVGTDTQSNAFLDQLIGKSVGSVSNITTKETHTVTEKINGEEQPAAEHELDVTYSDIKIHWIVDSHTPAAEFKYTPTETSTTDTNGNKLTELNKKELTYYVFPVYYVPVENADVAYNADEKKVTGVTLSAETIIREFYATVLKTETIEHDESEEHDHEEMTKYIFDCLESGNYKNTDKNKDLATLVTELKTLSEKETSKKTAFDKAEESLLAALKKLADATTDTAKEAQKTNVTKAREDYKKAKDELTTAESDVTNKIKEILACKHGETSLDADLALDYANYQYDTLETKYKNEINTNIATEIAELMTSSITYDKLPARAVRQARKAILNTYKYAYYEGKTGTSDTAISNYQAYANFDAYLIAAVEAETKATAGSLTIEDANDYIDQKAEDTVRDIILIYVLADEFDLNLTREEKKEYKKYYKEVKAQSEQFGSGYGQLFYYIYGVDPSTQSLDDFLNAKQFDKVMSYFLEVDEVNNSEKVQYLNINYTFSAAATK